MAISSVLDICCNGEQTDIVCIAKGNCKCMAQLVTVCASPFLKSIFNFMTSYKECINFIWPLCFNIWVRDFVDSRLYNESFVSYFYRFVDYFNILIHTHWCLKNNNVTVYDRTILMF